MNIKSYLLKDYFIKSSSSGHVLVGTIRSHSMWPLLKPGIVVVTKKTSLKDIMIGDIVYFCRNNDLSSLFIHRVLNINHDQKFCITKGDNNPIPDYPVKFSEIIGKAFGIEYRGKLIYFNNYKFKIINTLFYYHSFLKKRFPKYIPNIKFAKKILVRLFLKY